MKEINRKLLSDYRHLPNLPKFEAGGKPALTGIDGSQIGEYLIMTVRDPLCAYDDDPAAEIAKRLEGGKLSARTGMFLTYTGSYKGALISVVSGGSGSPEAELILNEFMMYSHANTFLRVGGSGGWNENVHPGDIVISSGAVRDEGMTRAYVVPQYPAVASFELVMALAEAGKQADVDFHIGITRSGDSEYCGWGKPSLGGYLQPDNTEIIDYYNRAGILNTDRETAAILTLTSLFGLRGGSICSIGDNVFNGEPFKPGAGHDLAIEIALNGLAILHKWDQVKQKHGKNYWTPSLDSD
jgi:uridine phosphorylase